VHIHSELVSLFTEQETVGNTLSFTVLAARIAPVVGSTTRPRSSHLQFLKTRVLQLLLNVGRAKSPLGASVFPTLRPREIGILLTTMTDLILPRVCLRSARKTCQTPTHQQYLFLVIANHIMVFITALFLTR